MFSLFRKRKPFFTEPERNQIVESVRQAELRTSGEVRVFVESFCPYVDAVDRAGEIFFRLEMDETAQHNAVLVYVALKDRQLAVFGDAGIHERVGTEYWNSEVGMMISKFNSENYADGISQCVLDIGQALQHHFPYDKATDKNELPDDIVFGK